MSAKQTEACDCGEVSAGTFILEQTRKENG